MRNPTMKMFVGIILVSFYVALWLTQPVVGADRLLVASSQPLGAAGYSLLEEDLFWAEPSDISMRDLFNGVGGKNGAPDLSNRFVEVNAPAGASGERVVEEEGTGRRWSLLTGSGARAEVSASRLVWAAGYHVDQSYFAREIRTADGGGGSRLLRNVRLKRMSANISPQGTWQWQSNPFTGSRQMQGLKVLMALLSNGDLGDENNRIVKLVDVNQRVFYIGNLRNTLGKTARLSGTAGNPSDYLNQKFIDKVQNGVIDFHNKGENSRALDGVKVEEARWMEEILRRLSDAQLEQAFRAGGFNDGEVQTYVHAVRSRIQTLQSLL